jgi:hypothetical protein
MAASSRTNVNCFKLRENALIWNKFNYLKCVYSVLHLWNENLFLIVTWKWKFKMLCIVKVFLFSLCWVYLTRLRRSDGTGNYSLIWSQCQCFSVLWDTETCGGYKKFLIRLHDLEFKFWSWKLLTFCKCYAL